MSRVRGAVASCVLAGLASSLGCRAGPPPDELYRRAEALRLQFAKASTEEAARHFEDAAARWERGGDGRSAVRARQRAALAYTQLGSLHRAAQTYDAALAAASKAGDPLLESLALSDAGIARSLVAVREPDARLARTRCEMAMTLAREAAAPTAEARAWYCLGEAAYNHGERERALHAYLQADSIVSRLGDRSAVGEVRAALGSVYSDRSEFDAAGTCFADARRAYEAAGDPRGAAIAAVGLAKVSERRGEYQAALNDLRVAREALERAGDLVWEGVSLAALGSVYMRLGDPPAAIDYWERALERFTTAGLSPFAVDQLRALGEAYLASGDAASALDRFERAHVRARELGDIHWEAYTLEAIGTVHLERGDNGRALSFLGRSIELHEQLRDPRTRARALAWLGEAHRRTGDGTRAREAFERSAQLSREAENRLGEAQALAGLARLAATAGQYENALAHIERGIAISESLRARLAGRALRSSFLASVYDLYQTHLDVLMAMYHARPRVDLAAAAFAAAEEAKARALLDDLAEAGVDPRADVDPALVRRQDALDRAFDEWAGRRRLALADRPSPEAIHRLDVEFSQLQTRHDALESELRSRSPRYAALARPRPLTLAQVQRNVLDADTVLLEYAFGEERGYLWVVSPSRVELYDLPPRAAVDDLVRRLYADATARLTVTGSPGERRRLAEAADLQYWASADALARVLLAPAARALRARRLVIVADASLHHVPFSALPDPGGPLPRTPLIEGHELVLLPSASALSALRSATAVRPSPAGHVAVFADPVFEADDPRLRALRPRATPRPDRLPKAPEAGLFPRLSATRAEADAIVSAAGVGTCASRLGFDASRTAATGDWLARYRVIHFATHGLIDDARPGMSGIMLSLFDANGLPVDGFLRLHDIYDLDLAAEIVVLSACRTALGRHVDGEGLVGVVRGFMHAGAKRVVASLWKVDDEATGELMRGFYGHLFRGGLPPVAALRQAQNDLRKNPRWQAPFYWAGFSLQGEWRP